MYRIRLLAFLFLTTSLWILLARDVSAWQLMNVDAVERMPPAQRLQWVEQQLGPYKGLINSAAKKHRIPPRLLGAVIINELADYDIKDKGQETIFSTGSVGMAQINVHTAIQHKLVDGASGSPPTGPPCLRSKDPTKSIPLEGR